MPAVLRQPTTVDVSDTELADARGRARYDRLFDACPQAYIQQSSDWAEVLKDIGPDRPLLLIARVDGEDVAGLPLYFFEHRLGNILTSVPQPGPLGGVFVRAGLPAPLREEVYRALLLRAVEIAQASRCVALSLITSFLDDDLAYYERHLEPDYVLENFTQYVRLDQPLRRSGGQRNNLARARRFGFTLGVCETAHNLEAWYEVHTLRHRQLGVTPPDFRLYEGMFRILVPKQRAIFLAVRDKEKIASACLYIRHLEVMDVYAISMDPAYFAHAPNALATEASLEWGRQRGVRIYNWQSSPSRQTGVYDYKRQWGSLETPYHFVTRTFCEPEVFTRLGSETIRAAYPGHYVVPFAVLEGEIDKRRFRKP